MPLRDLLFFLACLFLASWHLDHSMGDNSVSRAAMVAAIVEDGTLRIDAYESSTKDKAFVNGHYYSEKAPLPALLVVPFHAVVRWLGLVPSTPGRLSPALVMLGGFLCGSVPFALLVLFAMRRIRDRGSLQFAMSIALVALFGSFLFVYSGSFFGHLPAALFVVLAWSQRERDRLIPSGLYIGAAVLCEYSLIVFPLVWLIQDAVQRRWRAALHLILGGLPALCVLLVMNALITGDPLSLPYSHVASYGEQRGVFGIVMPSLTALRDLIWGPYRGLLWYAPVAVLALIAIFKEHGFSSIRYWALHPLVLPCILLLLMISAHTMWWGGWAFGPRHITVIAVLLLVAGLPLVPDHPLTRWSFGVLGTIGLLLAVAAKNTVWGAFPSGVEQPVGTILIPALRDGAWTDMQWPVSFGLAPEISSLLFLLTFAFVLVLCYYWDRQRTA